MLPGQPKPDGRQFLDRFVRPMNGIDPLTAKIWIYRDRAWRFSRHLITRFFDMLLDLMTGNRHNLRAQKARMDNEQLRDSWDSVAKALARIIDQTEKLPNREYEPTFVMSLENALEHAERRADALIDPN